MSAVRVIKLGGSLRRSTPASLLASRLRLWLQHQPAMHNVIVVGGGSLVDNLREYSLKQHLSESKAHELAIWLMSLGAQLFADQLLHQPAAYDFNQLQTQLQSTPAGISVLDVTQFLLEVEPLQPGSLLPHTWAVTSDSIAARLASALKAQELVLLKSCLKPKHLDWQRLAEKGYVDSFFPEAALAIPSIRWCNFSAEL